MRRRTKILGILAVVSLVASAAVIGVSIYSDGHRESRPLGMIDHDRSVAVGVHKDSDFTGVRWAMGPNFQFRVRSDLTWQIWFNLAVFLPQPNTDLITLPSVVVLMPRDATNCIAGYQVLYGSEGNNSKGSEDNSTIAELAPTAQNRVFAVRPKSVTHDRVTGNPLARYEIACDTTSLNTNSAGLASKNFEILYLPGQATSAGVIPGLGAINDSFRLVYGRYRLVAGKEDNVSLNGEILDPQPTAKVDDGYFWDFPKPLINQSIQGTVSTWWISLIHSIRGWLIGFFVVALVGFLFDPVKDFIKGEGKEGPGKS